MEIGKNKQKYDHCLHGRKEDNPKKSITIQSLFYHHKYFLKPQNSLLKITTIFNYPSICKRCRVALGKTRVCGNHCPALLHLLALTKHDVAPPNTGSFPHISFENFRGKPIYFFTSFSLHFHFPVSWIASSRLNINEGTSKGLETRAYQPNILFTWKEMDKRKSKTLLLFVFYIQYFLCTSLQFLTPAYLLHLQINF